LQQLLTKQIKHRGKKEKRPDLARPRQIWARSAQPARRPAPRRPKQYGLPLAVRLDDDRWPEVVVHTSYCMRAREMASARVSRGEAHRGCSGGRRRLAWWRRFSGGGLGPNGLHAGPAALAVTSKSPTCSPAGGGDGDACRSLQGKRGMG
jgi:hypothetical protein